MMVMIMMMIIMMVMMMLTLRPVYTSDIGCDFAAILSAIFSFEGCEEVNQL